MVKPEEKKKKNRIFQIETFVEDRVQCGLIIVE